MALAFLMIENALHAWVVASTGLAAGSVIWADQNVPQRARPFATLKLLDLGHIGQDALVQSYSGSAPAGQEISFTVDGRRELTVSVQAFAEATTGASTARALLAKAQTALSLPSVQQALRAAGLAILNEGRIIDLTELLETRWQSRAAVSVQFHCVDSAIDRTGYIATVDISEAT